MKIVKKILTAILCAALATGIAAAFAGCGHAHVWSDEWESDSAGHSHECTECGEVAAEEHTYSGGVCVVCGYECEHGEWERDKLNHWQTCTECGEQFSSEHNFVSGECTVCGYECVHEYAAEWSCDTQMHWHECTICASVNGEKAHEYLLGECTECGYECAHEGLKWGYDGYHHWGECAVCKQNIIATHVFINEVCTICGTSEPEPTDISYILGAKSVEIWHIMSSHSPVTTTDEVWLNRTLNALEGVKFVEGSYTTQEILEHAPDLQIIAVGINTVEGALASFRIYQDGSVSLEYPFDASEEKQYLAPVGSVDYGEIQSIADGIMNEHYEHYH